VISARPFPGQPFFQAERPVALPPGQPFGDPRCMRNLELRAARPAWVWISDLGGQRAARGELTERRLGGRARGGAVGDQALAGLALKIQATKQSDVKVIADGKVVFDGSVQRGDVKQFDAQDNFEITSSESSAVSLELNGQSMPPMGTPGQPGSVALTRNNLKPATGDSH